MRTATAALLLALAAALPAQGPGAIRANPVGEGSVVLVLDERTSTLARLRAALEAPRRDR